MAATTTIKVPIELRDRLALIADHGHMTLAGAIAVSLDAAEDARFWADVARTMGGDSSRRVLADDAEAVAIDLTDGLDPDESWDDVW